MTNNTKRLTHKEFALRGVEKLVAKGHKGIHLPWSGYNEAHAKYFGYDMKNGGKEKVRADVDALVAKGDVIIRPTKGGVIMYNPDNMPTTKNVDDTLASILS